jgi:ABC-type uncharacterized transport system auxiliary subunit
MRRINGFRLSFGRFGPMRPEGLNRPLAKWRLGGPPGVRQQRASRLLASWAVPLKRLAAVSIALVALAACGGKIPPTNYYVLDLPAPETKPANTLPYTAVVMPFRGSEMLVQDRIVYRESPSRVGFYEYHRWAEDPRTTLLGSLLSQLRAAGAFDRVVPFEGRTSVDYIIRGRLEQLEEVDYGEGVSVKVKISAQLVDATTNRPVWSGTSEAAGRVATAEVSAVVEQMSSAMRSAVSKIVDGINTHLRSGAAQSAASSAPSAREAQR